ncbi:hypothetical protein AcW1_010130 [Taiwanofungus camphoratus]|nr:hypothetical protein AcV5_003025 [Antrodia cinnamomea]KAI0946760.1 hypothetical protein AcW1_010130 [Antrodia cinnamomea]
MSHASFKPDQWSLTILDSRFAHHHCHLSTYPISRMNNHSQIIDKAEGSTVETLDIEDEERRQARMHELFMKLDASSSTRHISEEKQNMFNFDDRRTFATEPHRDLLSRVQRFLPQLAASNAELTRRLREDPRSIDLENIENDEHYIEMNLGLGVFEGRTASGSNSTDGEEDRSSSLLSSESSEQESESESDTDSDTSGGSDSDAGAR